jgi:K+-sensing histidine kinase KdpD
MTKASDDDSINSEIVELFHFWRHDGLKPLTAIIGYATLLLEFKSENLTEQQKHFVTSIRDSAMRASASWHSTSDYLQLRFDFENMDWKWESVQLSEICERILSKSLEYTNKSNVQVNVPDELAPIRADRNWLSRAITNLLEPSVGYRYNAEFKSSISAQKRDDRHVVVRISTGLKLSGGDNDISIKYKLSIGYNPNSIELISWPGNSLSVANIILEKHGSRLEFRNLKKDNDEYESEGTEFTFVLPTSQ